MKSHGRTYFSRLALFTNRCSDRYSCPILRDNWNCGLWWTSQSCLAFDKKLKTCLGAPVVSFTLIILGVRAVLGTGKLFVGGLKRKQKPCLHELLVFQSFWRSKCVCWALWARNSAHKPGLSLHQDNKHSTCGSPCYLTVVLITGSPTTFLTRKPSSFQDGNHQD